MRIERALVGLVCIAVVAAPGCSGGRLAYNLPPASRLMEPGPGVGGPGPGVIPPAAYPFGIYGGAVGRFGDGAGMPVGGYGECPPCGPYAANPGFGVQGSGFSGSEGVVQASYDCGCSGCSSSDSSGYGYQPVGYYDACPPDHPMAHHHRGHLRGLLHGAPMGLHPARPGMGEAFMDAAAMAAIPTSQIAFIGEEGVQVSWDVSGYGLFDSVPLVIPGRQDFFQGAIYRLRLTNIPGRPGVELYPTLEVAPVTPRTDAYLAHSPVPVQFTVEDFDQVLAGNFVTKVIYLPDPEFQELALAGVETLVSTRLAPGVDPIAEADRRGSILAIVRMGNKDLRRGAPLPEFEFEPQFMVPAGYVTPVGGASPDSYETNAMYHEELGADGQPTAGGVVPAQYGYACGPADCPPHGAHAMAGMPLGMPTAAMAPPAIPPHLVAGAPQWGMPMTGTPIGLPGPPHVPLGIPAGLQRHQMHNRTRVHMPPPTAKVQLSVRQRPGLNYPHPVNHVHVEETQREPFSFAGLFGGLFRHHAAGHQHHGHAQPRSHHHGDPFIRN